MIEKPTFIAARGKPLPPYTRTHYSNGSEYTTPGSWDQSVWIIWRQKKGSLIPIREVSGRKDAERITASLNGGNAP